MLGAGRRRLPASPCSGVRGDGLDPRRPPACDSSQAYTYLNEGERLLKTLKDKKSWSQTFELATFYCLKGQVRRHRTRH